MRIPFLKQKKKGEPKLPRTKRSPRIKRIVVVSSPDQRRIQRETDYEKRLNTNLQERRTYGRK